MAATVDERIVAAKFDASDFEKGVDKTLKKLDELKKSLDLKEATKGVKELAEKTKDSTNSLSNSLEKLTDRFTTFTGMIKQKILSGLADEVANVFLKMEQSVKGFIQSISTAQISAGMSKYEQLLTSVRIMMSAGETQDSAYNAINQLQEYSDQTSYSLSQMTDALSKMRAAGVDLDTATKNVEGIANACANAGINASDAQRAFYNLSQAFSSGTLKYTDYRSLELLNMTTEKFKINMLEAAVEAGTLKKVSDGVYKTINTTDKKVKAGKKVTVQNLNDMLRYDFMNNAAMSKLFGKKFYFDEKEFKKYKKKYTDDNGVVDREKAIAEAKKDFGEIAVDAYLAAREARSFTDVINTLKDVVSTGWSSTFEHLFGKLEQAKNFFTELAEGGIADVIYKIGEYRNAILDFWDDSVSGVASGGGEAFRQTILHINDALGTLLKTFLSILPGFEELNNEEDEATPGLQNLGDKLYLFTLSLRDAARRIKEASEEFRKFMNSPTIEGGPTRIEKIRTVLINLASVFGVIGKVSSIAIMAIDKAYRTLYPIFDGILIFLSKITAPLRTLQYNEVFESIEDSVRNIFTIIKPISVILEKIVSFLGDAGQFFVQMSIDTAVSNITFFSDILGLFFELFTGKSAQMERGEGVLKRIKDDFEGIKSACKDGLAALNEFFGTIISDVKKLFGLTKEEGEGNQNGGAFAGVINFFKTNEFVKSAKAWVKQAIVDIGNFIKSIPAKVKVLGANIYDVVRKLLFTKEQEKDTGKEKEVLTPLGEWLNGVIAKVKAFILDVPNKIIKGIGKVTNWIDTIFNSIFGTSKESGDAKKEINDSAETAEEKTKNAIITQFEEFIANVKQTVLDWFSDLPSKITTAFNNVGNFFNKVVSAVMDFLFGKKTVNEKLVYDQRQDRYVRKKAVTRVKTGFSKWLDNVIKDIKKFISDIPSFIKKKIKNIGDIVSTVVNSIFGSDNKETTGSDIENKLKKPFLDINLTSVINTIKDIGMELINQIARIFTGTDDITSNTEWLVSKFNEAVDWIVEQIPKIVTGAWDFIKKLGINIWNGLKTVFTGGTVSKDDPAITKAIIDIGTAVKTWLTDKEKGLPKYFSDAWATLSAVGSNVWTGFSSVFTGANIPEDTKDNVIKFAETIGLKVKDWLTNTETGLPKYFSDAWESVKNFIVNDLPNVFSGFSNFISDLLTGGKSDNVAKDINKEAHITGKAIKDGFHVAAKEVGDSTGEASGFSSFGDRLKESFLPTIISIGTTIKDWLTNDQYGLPFYFNQAWATLSAVGSSIWLGFTSIFKEEGLPGDTQSIVAETVYNIGTKIKDWIIKDLPGYFSQAWEFLSRLGSDIWQGFKGIFSNSEPPEGTESDVTEFVRKTGIKIKNWLTNPETGLPKFFKDAWADITRFVQEDLPGVIEGISKFISDIFTGSSEPDKDTTQKVSKNAAITAKAIKKGFSLAVKDVGKDSEKDQSKKSGILSFAESFKNAFLDAISSIGPAILNGLATALNWISDVAGFIMDALTGKASIGDKIETAYGKEKPELVQALSNIGESLKRFFLDTIPKFIGSAMAALAEQAPEWITKLTSAFSSASADAEKDAESGLDTEKAITSASNGAEVLMNMMHGLFDRFAFISGENIVGVIAIMIAIGVVLSHLKELFSLTREMEAGVDAIKWTAITLAISAIAGIFFYISKLVNSGEADKIDEFKGILDKLKDMLIALAVVLGASAIGKLSDALGEKWGSVAGATEKVSGIAGLFSNLLGSFGTAFGIGAGVGAGSAIAGEGISFAIENVGDAIDTLITGLNDTMASLLPFIDDLVNSKSQITLAIDVVDELKELFVKFYKAFNSLYTDSTGNRIVNIDDGGTEVVAAVDESNRIIQQITSRDGTAVSITGLTKALSERMGVFTAISDFVTSLLAMLEKLNAANSAEEVKKNINNVIGIFTSTEFDNLMTELMKALNKNIAKDDFKYQKYSYAAVMEMVSESITAMSTGLASMDLADVTNFKTVIGTFTEMAGILGDTNLLGNKNLSKFGSQIKQFGAHISDFTESLDKMKGFSDDKTDETKRKLNSIFEIAKASSEIAIKLSNQYVPDSDVFTSYIGNLPGFGKAVGDFYSKLNEAFPKNVDSDRVHSLYEASGIMSNMLVAVKDLANLFLQYNNLTVDEVLNQVLSSTNKVSAEGTETAGKFATIFVRFTQAISKSLDDDSMLEEFKQLGSKFYVKLNEGIQAAIDEDPSLQPKITPVLDLEPAKGQLRQFFGVDQMPDVDLSALARSATGANAHTDTDRVTATLFTAKMDSVISSVGALSTNTATVADVTNAFVGMRVVTDTGVLVGALTDDIDAAIGRKIWLIQRGVTPVVMP